MSFRARLTLFFVVIVVVPLVAVGAIVYALIGDNEQAKSDAGLNANRTLAMRVYDASLKRSKVAARTIGTDPALGTALRDGDRAALRRRADALRVATGATRAVIRRDADVLTDVGDPNGVFPYSSVLTDQATKRDLGLLQVSSITGDAYVRELRGRLGVQAVVRRDGHIVASTVPGLAASDLPGDRGSVQVGDAMYDAASFATDDSFGRRTLVTVLAQKAPSERSARESRWILAGVILGFLVLACTFAILVSRSLQNQIGSLLEAARRMAGGDFSAKVPTKGRDEFAALGQEFNRMSEELERRLAELRQERARLQDSLRRIGETFASSLDREGLVEIALRTTLDGIDADGGRATLRRDGDRLEPVATAGRLTGLEGALHAAEAVALETGRPSEVTVDDVRSLAHPLRGDGNRVEGVMAVARKARPFGQSERDLFHYLAGQAGVSIENVGLHETVERQAVTDELTGLSNRRRFDDALDAEVERARRFSQPLGLVLLDLDDFKRVNDDYGHQIGDEVLREVARVLRASCREIDEPARYGGEELAVVLPGTDLAGAERLAERVRREVEALEVPLGDGHRPLRITTSLGVATLPGSAYDSRSLVEAADDALYRAKRTGKNRTMSAV